MTRSARFNVYNKAEVLLLLELAREHEPHIHLGFKELPESLQLYVETDCQELSDYIQFMLGELRRKQLAMEATFTGQRP